MIVPRLGPEEVKAGGLQREPHGPTPSARSARQCQSHGARWRAEHAHRGRRSPTSTEDGNVRFNVNCRLQDFRTSLVGVLHSAYLRMFYLLGSEYVVNPNVERLRNDLGRLAAGGIPRAKIAQHFAPYRKVMFQHQLPASWKWSHVVTTPPGCRSFLAVVRRLPGSCIMVILPGFWKEGRRAFQRLLRNPARRSFHVCSLELSELTREERLRNVQLKAFGRRLWEDAGTHNSNLRRAMCCASAQSCKHRHDRGQESAPRHVREH